MRHCISYDDTEFTKVIAGIWKHIDKSDGATNTSSHVIQVKQFRNKPTVLPDYLKYFFLEVKPKVSTLEMLVIVPSCKGKLTTASKLCSK